MNSLHPNKNWTGQWAYAKSLNSRSWIGPCETREEVMRNAFADFDKNDYEDLKNIKDLFVYISPCRVISSKDDDVIEGWTFVVCGTVEQIKVTFTLPSADPV